MAILKSDLGAQQTGPKGWFVEHVSQAHILPASFVWLVLLVAAAKMQLEDAALVAGT